MPFQIPSRNNPAEDGESRQARPETVPAGIARPGIDMGESMPEVPAPPSERPGPAESERERENARSGPDADQAERDSRAMRATAAVDRVADATKYGLTIPFLRWLLSYKAGLTAEQFAIASAEDLALADGERVQRAATPAVGSPDETRHAGSGPATEGRNMAGRMARRRMSCPFLNRGSWKATMPNARPSSDSSAPARR